MKTVALDKCKAETSTTRMGADVGKFWEFSICYHVSQCPVCKRVVNEVYHTVRCS